MLDNVLVNCALFFQLAAYLKCVSRNWYWRMPLKGLRVRTQSHSQGQLVNYAVIFCARLSACGTHTHTQTATCLWHNPEKSSGAFASIPPSLSLFLSLYTSIFNTQVTWQRLACCIRICQKIAQRKCARVKPENASSANAFKYVVAAARRKT